VGQQRLSAHSTEDRLLRARRIGGIGSRSFLRSGSECKRATVEHGVRGFRRRIAGLICLTARCVSAERLHPVRVTLGADKQRRRSWGNFMLRLFRLDGKALPTVLAPMLVIWHRLRSQPAGTVDGLTVITGHNDFTELRIPRLSASPKASVDRARV